MNISQPINTMAIDSIEQLADGHPVYLVRLNNGECVIKSEDVANARAVQDPAEIMAIVDPNAKSRVLSKTELMGLRAWTNANPAGLDDLITRLKGALMPPMPTPGMPSGMARNTNTMIVMEAKKNLRDLESAGMAALGGNKDTVRKLAKVFAQPGVIEKLGEVLAADAFIGNQDRVNFADGSMGMGGGKIWQGSQLKCIQNPGNFFVADEGGRATVVGLDQYDPTNMMFADLRTWLSQGIKESDGFPYPGRVLRRDAGQRRQTLAQNVVEDIETIMGPRRRRGINRNKTTKRLPMDAPGRITRGMESGATKILNGLKQRYMAGGVPKELQFRLNAIGWLTRTNFPRL